MDAETVKRAIVKFEESIPKETFEREMRIPEMPFDKAVAIVGPRRAGKTYYLYNTYKKQAGRKPIFINFEDNLIKGIGDKELNIIPQASTELFEAKDFSFFLDEIQIVEGWESFAISLLNSHHKVYATGSNSRTLSKDIATALRGKALPFLLLPLSFTEFLKMKSFELDKRMQYSGRLPSLKRLFQEYLIHGGFPEIALAKELELKNRLANNYFDTIIYKDTIERNKITNAKLATNTAKYLLNLYANTFSIAAYENYLKSNKTPYSLEDIYTILGTLKDIYFISYVKQYSKSYKKSEFSKAKIYLFDTAYITFLASETTDMGRILENLVFIELFRRQNTLENTGIYYHQTKNGKECDFIIKNNSKITHAIQVCYRLTQKNREREIHALSETMKELGIKQGIILTHDQEEKTQKTGISIKPVWKWLLET
ncbi:AAA domain protein [uncultured archaeon]|nr:AAA domain protein [uncultured archaeon]